jgi:cellulose synthase (UDP-forming)
MAPYLALASLYELIFARPIPFKVTPKGKVTNKTTFKWKLAMPHLVLVVLTIIGWIVTFTTLNISNGNLLNLVTINMFWSVYNIFALIASVMICIERPRVRTDERISTEENLMVKNEYMNCETSKGETVCKVDYREQVCEIKDLSESGARIQCRINNKEVALDEIMAQKDDEIYVNIEDVGNLKGKIKRSVSEEDVNDMGIKFEGLSDEEYDRLVKKIYDKNDGYFNNN